MRLKLIGVAVLAVLCSMPAVVRAEDKLVVVMPFDRRHATLTEADVLLVEEAVRSSAGNALASKGFNVLTSDTALALLRERGVDPERVQEAESALSAAKALRANLFLSGSITSSGGKHAGQVRIFRVEGGKLLASVEIGGQSADGLKRSWKSRDDQFFESALAAMGQSAPAAKKPVATEPVVAKATPPAAASEDGEEGPADDEVKAKGRRESVRLKRLCDRGDAKACVARGQMYLIGEQGLRPNRGVAKDHFARGCNLGAYFGCTVLGVMYRDGDFVEKDLAMAMSLFKQACDGGDVDGCTQAKALKK